MFNKLKSYLFLHFIHFLIYTAFLYIQISIISIKIPYSQPSNITNYILIAIEGISVLLGGLLAAFVIPAIFLIVISFGSLLIGISIFVVLFDIVPDISKHNYQVLFLISLILFSVFVGLFRFLFLVIILDQNESKFIERKFYGWLMTINISYIFVYIILPIPTKGNHFEIICFVTALVGIILFIIGKYLKYFVIDSDIVNIFNVIKGFRGKRRSIGCFNSLEDKNAIISISTSVIFFILLIPIGICDSQSRYAYMYQSFYFKLPSSSITSLWFMLFSTISVIIFSLILLCVKIFNLNKLKKLLSNVRLNIIVGIILLIIASILSGLVEYIRLQMFNTNICKLNQTIGGKDYIASCLSIFILIPQNVINGVGEVFIFSTCIKYLYKQSIKSIKYMSISLVLAAIGSGGLSDIFFIVLPYVDGFNKDRLNEAKLKPENRLDYIYYFLGFIALLSLIIGIILMNQFPKRFSTTLPEDSIQSSVVINDESLQSSLINNDNVENVNNNTS